MKERPAATPVRVSLTRRAKGVFLCALLFAAAVRAFAVYGVEASMRSSKTTVQLASKPAAAVRDTGASSEMRLSNPKAALPSVYGSLDGRDERTPKESSLSLGRNFRSRSSFSGRVFFRDLASLARSGHKSHSKETSQSSTLSEDEALEAPLLGLKTVLAGTLLLSLVKVLPRLAGYDLGVRLLQGLRWALRGFNKTAPLGLELSSALLGATIALLLSGLHDLVKSLHKLLQASNDEMSESALREDFLEFYPVRGQILLTVGMLSVLLAQFQWSFFGENRRDLRFAVALTFPALFVGAVLVATSLTKRYLIWSWLKRTRLTPSCFDCTSAEEDVSSRSSSALSKRQSRVSSSSRSKP